jgi:DsbC/DsbD-like thiol-disulfide interchange protein
VAAEASWLACKDVCLLGSARLEERWPLPAAAAEFERWRAELPATDPPFSVNVTGGWAPGSRRTELTLWLSWPAPPGEVELFPEAGDRLKLSAPRVQSRGALTRVDLEATVVGGSSAPPERLTAVVTARTAPESRRAWEIVIPLTALP